MAAPARTLDIKEPQIIRNYPADPNGFLWHHRILLEKTGPGHWIGLTPDFDLERIDLNVTRHITLERRRDFPAAQAPFVYAFDPLARGELDGFKRRAKVLASLFNEGEVVDMDAYEWLIADTSRPDFGDRVTDEEIDDGVVLRESAIIERNGEEVFARMVAISDKAAWILAKENTKGDIRLLGEHRDSRGKRFLDFKTAVGMLRSSPIDDWPLVGPRALQEYLCAVRDGSTDMSTYHQTWVQTSGVSPFSAASHEHRVLCDMVRVGLGVDQLDLSNTMMGEIAVRRLIQIETAVARSPATPDYSGLDLIMEQSVGPAGQAVTTTFNSWIATKLKERANVQKQARLYREEFGACRGSGTSSQETGGKRGRGRGRAGTPKGKAKPGDGGAAGGAT